MGGSAQVSLGVELEDPAKAGYGSLTLTRGELHLGLFRRLGATEGLFRRDFFATGLLPVSYTHLTLPKLCSV